MNITDLFIDKSTITRIQEHLPELFHIAELESARAGKVGMEVGSVRERILIALLLYKFGAGNVETEIPITESEIDVIVLGNPLSIKTITAKYLGGVKLIWTVDADKAFKFSQEYYPRCDILLAQVNWDDLGWIYYFPRIAQIDVFEQLGNHSYIKLPKAGTNPRGVEISSKALTTLSIHPQSLNIPIKWYRKKVEYNPYKRWLELWKRE